MISNKRWTSPALLQLVLVTSMAVDGQSAVPRKPVDTIDVAEAIMVTVELDFGSLVPGIGDAIKEIERRSIPGDGRGRTFAILDAYGEATADGKLHLSMHVSTEKPGEAMLIFRRTGEVLWHGRIVQGAKPGGRPQNLGIFIEQDGGRTVTVDGSTKPKSILDASIQGSSMKVRDLWPEGAERSVSFLYSTCGCPVKAPMRRAGERILRIGESPVMFPDDPEVMSVLGGLLGW